MAGAVAARHQVMRYGSAASGRWPALRAFIWGVSILIGLLVGSAYGGQRYQQRLQKVAATNAAVNHFVEIVAHELSQLDYPSVERSSQLLMSYPLLVSLEVQDAFNFEVFSATDENSPAATSNTYHARDPNTGDVVGRVKVAYNALDTRVFLAEIFLVGSLLIAVTALIVSLLFKRYIKHFVESPTQKVLAAIEQTVATDQPVFANHSDDSFLGYVTRQFNQMQTRLSELLEAKNQLIKENSRINQDLQASIQHIRHLQKNTEQLLNMQNRVLETTGQKVRFFDASGVLMENINTNQALLKSPLGQFRHFPSARGQLEQALTDAGYEVSSREDSATAMPIVYTVEARSSDQVLLTFTAFRFDAESAALLCRDISEERSRELHMNHLLRIEAIGQLTSAVAHNFNNFLAIIMGSAELALAATTATSKTHRQLEAIVTTTKNASDMTDKLLGYVRKDGGESQRLHLRTHLADNEDLLRSLVSAEHRFSITVETDSVIDIIPGELDAILINLIKNANQAMSEPGAIAVSTRDLAVEKVSSLGLQSDSAYVTITVRDTGPGMDECTVAQVFDPFFTTKPREHGIGLGLSSVFRSISRMGGNIKCDSKFGVGTTFRFYLPAKSSAHSAPPIEASPVAESDHRHLQILIVEDEPLLGQLLVEAFRDRGCTATLADSYHVGREVLCNSQIDSYNAILADHHLGDGSGIEFLKQTSNRNPNARRILMSGNLLSEQSLDFVDLFKQKPFKLKDIVNSVLRLTRGSN